MKSIILIMLVVFLVATELFSQDHIAPCNGPQNHSGGICYGYATGRAAGRLAGDSICNPITFYQNTINTAFFNFVEDTSLSGLQSGDIIKFQYHAAYVVSVGSPIATSRVDQYSTMWNREEKNISLDSVKKVYGAWSGYYRAKLIDITVQNSFSGGLVKINNSTVNTGTKAVDWRYSQSLEAVDRQNILDPIKNVYYIRLFQYWMIPPDSNNSNLRITIIPKPGRTYTAFFEKEFNITFQNNFIGANGGQIKVNGIIQNAPFTTQILARNPPQAIASEAIYNQINCIVYTFSHWWDGITTNPRTFTPNDHQTYTAHYTAKPLHPDYLYAGGEVGQPVHLTWQIHPHLQVTYEVWRKIDAGKGTPYHPPWLLASLPRTTTSYTDYEYTNTDGYTDDLVWYDVRTKFLLNNSLSDPWWRAAFATDGSSGGLPAPKIAQGEELNIMEMSVPANYQITSYPNPFNPNTIIEFAIPELSDVKLTVYNILGQEVAVLINSQIEAGYQSITWNAQNNSGAILSSGIYLYRFEATSRVSNKHFNQVNKMLFVK